MDLEIALLFAVFFTAAAPLMAMIWMLHRAILLSSATPTNPDPIIVRRERVAIHDAYEAYIPMPDNLRTKDEMVAWMTKELPKLTAEAVRFR